MYMDEYFSYKRSMKMAEDASKERRFFTPHEVGEIGQHMHVLADTRQYQWLREITPLLSAMVVLVGGNVSYQDLESIRLFGELISEITQRLNPPMQIIHSMAAPAA